MRRNGNSAEAAKMSAALGVGAITGLGEERRRVGALKEADDLGDGVVLVQRRVADIAVARAGEENDYRLDPVGQPHRNALAALQAGVV